MRTYCAIIFDLKKSRMLANRRQVQRELIDAIQTFNAKYETGLVSPFLIIIGDEWQGLLRSVEDCRIAIEFFSHRLGLPFYVGVGIGECTVFSEELTVNQLDGPAFYKARHAMRLAKEHGYSEVFIE